MRLSLLLAGVLLLVSTKCQGHNKDLCDTNPASAVFEDKSLRRVIKLFKVLDKCSPTIWKDESIIDQTKLNDLEAHNKNSEKYWRSLDPANSNKPRSQTASKIFIGAIDKRSTTDLELSEGFLELEVQRSQEKSITGNLVSEKFINKRQIPGGPGFFGFENSGFPGFPKDFFQPNDEGNFYPFSSQKKPQSKKSSDDFSRPNNEVGSQDQADLFFPNIQRRTQNQEPSKGFFGPNNNQEGQKNKIYYFPRGLTKPSQDQKRPKNSFRPNVQRKPKKINVNKDNNSVTPKDERRTQTPQKTSFRLETTTLPGPAPWPTAPSTCVKKCPHTPEFNPVCGSDRVTYKNPGRLSCEQQCGKEHVKINYYGNCIATTPPPKHGKGNHGRTTPPTFSWNFGR